MIPVCQDEISTWGKQILSQQGGTVFCLVFVYTVKPLNSGHLRILKNLSDIERCPLLGGNFKKIVTCGT